MAYNPDSGSDYGWDDYPPAWYFSKKIDQYVIFGESQVGKTTFLDKFLGPDRVNLYNDNRHCMFLDSALLTIDFTDLSSTALRTADSTFDASYFTKYLSQALGVVLIYDVTNLASFQHITNEAYMYLAMCKSYMEGEQGGKRVECVLVGNKVDLVEGGNGERREVDGELAREWAESQGMEWFEVSAKTFVGVWESVHALVRSAERAKEREVGKGKGEEEEKEKEEKGAEGGRKMAFRERIKSVFKKSGKRAER